MFIIDIFFCILFPLLIIYIVHFIWFDVSIISIIISVISYIPLFIFSAKLYRKLFELIFVELLEINPRKCLRPDEISFDFNKKVKKLIQSGKYDKYEKILKAFVNKKDDHRLDYEQAFLEFYNNTHDPPVKTKHKRSFSHCDYVRHDEGKEYLINAYNGINCGHFRDKFHSYLIEYDIDRGEFEDFLYNKLSADSDSFDSDSFFQIAVTYLHYENFQPDIICDKILSFNDKIQCICIIYNLLVRKKDLSVKKLISALKNEHIDIFFMTLVEWERYSFGKYKYISNYSEEDIKMHIDAYERHLNVKGLNSTIRYGVFYKISDANNLLNFLQFSHKNGDVKSVNILLYCLAGYGYTIDNIRKECLSIIFEYAESKNLLTSKLAVSALASFANSKAWERLFKKLLINDLFEIAIDNIKNKYFNSPQIKIFEKIFPILAVIETNDEAFIALYNLMKGRKIHPVLFTDLGKNSSLIHALFLNLFCLGEGGLNLCDYRNIIDRDSLVIFIHLILDKDTYLGTIWKLIYQCSKRTYNNEVVQELCKENNQITSNILHLILKMPNTWENLATRQDPLGTVKAAGYNPHEKIKIAQEELENRGNPPYVISAYMKQI